MVQIGGRKRTRKWRPVLVCIFSFFWKIIGLQVGVSWQWYNAILRRADAAGKELLVIILDETYVPFFFGMSKGCLARGSHRYQNDQCNEAHLLYARFEAFITRHGCRVRGSHRYQNDQCNEAHLLYAKLEAFITRHGCRVRGSHRYQHDQCNEAHL